MPDGAGEASGGSNEAGVRSGNTFSALFVLCSSAVRLSEMLEGLYCGAVNAAASSRAPVSRLRSQVQAALAHTTNSATALAIRVCSAARRASASGTPCGFRSPLPARSCFSLSYFQAIAGRISIEPPCA